MPDTITLSLPADTPLPAPVGKWRRGRSKRIIATYTLEELAWALCFTDSHEVGLERLEELDDALGHAARRLGCYPDELEVVRDAIVKVRRKEAQNDAK